MTEAEQARAFLTHLWRLTEPGSYRADASLHSMLHDFLTNWGHNESQERFARLWGGTGSAEDAIRAARQSVAKEREAM